MSGLNYEMDNPKKNRLNSIFKKLLGYTEI